MARVSTEISEKMALISKFLRGSRVLLCSDKTSINVQSFSARTVSFATRAISPRKKTFPRKCDISVFRHSRSQRREKREYVVQEAVMGICKTFSGIAVITAGPSARLVNPKLQQYFIWPGDNWFVTSAENDCVPASVINGVGILRVEQGVEHSRKIFVGNHTHFTKVGLVGPIIRKMGLEFSISKPKTIMRYI